MSPSLFAHQLWNNPTKPISSCLEAAQTILFFPYCKALLCCSTRATATPCNHHQAQSPPVCYETGKICLGLRIFALFKGKPLRSLCWKIPTPLPSSMSMIPLEVSTMIPVENPQVHPSAWHDARQSPPIMSMQKQR